MLNLELKSILMRVDSNFSFIIGKSVKIYTSPFLAYRILQHNFCILILFAHWLKHLWALLVHFVKGSEYSRFSSINLMKSVYFRHLVQIVVFTKNICFYLWLFFLGLQALWSTAFAWGGEAASAPLPRVARTASPRAPVLSSSRSRRGTSSPLPRRGWVCLFWNTSNVCGSATSSNFGNVAQPSKTYRGYGYRSTEHYNNGPNFNGLQIQL